LLHKAGVSFITFEYLALQNKKQAWFYSKTSLLLVKNKLVFLKEQACFFQPVMSCEKFYHLNEKNL